MSFGVFMPAVKRFPSVPPAPGPRPRDLLVHLPGGPDPRPERGVHPPVRDVGVLAGEEEATVYRVPEVVVVRRQLSN